VLQVVARDPAAGHFPEQDAAAIRFLNRQPDIRKTVLAAPRRSDTWQPSMVKLRQRRA
jgi:hypothetical protein